MLLAGDLGEQVEVGVVVQDGQIAGLGAGGEKGIDERQCSMVAACSQLSLDVTCSLVVGVSCGD